MSTIELISISISIVSALTAVVSVAVAQRASRTADKMYAVDLIGRLYDLYRADTMLHSMQVTWNTYRQTWNEIGNSPDQARQLADSGAPIPSNIAEEFVSRHLGKKEDSEVWIAIHELNAFWKYLALLVAQNSINESYVSAFTSPEILGFLYPIERAYCEEKGLELHPKTSLQALYEEFRAKGQIRPSN